MTRKNDPCLDGRFQDWSTKGLTTAQRKRQRTSTVGGTTPTKPSYSGKPFFDLIDAGKSAEKHEENDAFWQEAIEGAIESEKVLLIAGEPLSVEEPLSAGVPVPSGKQTVAKKKAQRQTVARGRGRGRGRGIAKVAKGRGGGTGKAREGKPKPQKKAQYTQPTQTAPKQQQRSQQHPTAGITAAIAAAPTGDADQVGSTNWLWRCSQNNLLTAAEETELLRVETAAGCHTTGRAAAATTAATVYGWQENDNPKPQNQQEQKPQKKAQYTQPTQTQPQQQAPRLHQQLEQVQQQLEQLQQQQQQQQQQRTQQKLDQKKKLQLEQQRIDREQQRMQQQLEAEGHQLQTELGQEQLDRTIHALKQQQQEIHTLSIQQQKLEEKKQLQLESQLEEQPRNITFTVEDEGQAQAAAEAIEKYKRDKRIQQNKARAQRIQQLMAELTKLNGIDASLHQQKQWNDAQKQKCTQELLQLKAQQKGVSIYKPSNVITN